MFEYEGRRLRVIVPIRSYGLSVRCEILKADGTRNLATRPVWVSYDQVLGGARGG